MANKHSWQTRPWSAQIAPGVFSTPKRDMWVYRSFPLAALEWEDAPRRLELQGKLERFLVELGESARDLGGGVRALTRTRSLHVVSILYDTQTTIPGTVPTLLADFQRRAMFDSSPNKVMLVGIKLERDAMSALSNADSDDSMLKRFVSAIKATAQVPTDLSLFARDYERVQSIFSRAGATEPTEEEISQLTSWFNSGEGLDVVIASGSTKFQLSNGRTWQLSALMGSDERFMQMPSPFSPWVMDAMNHYEGAKVVSIRSELEPASVTRGRLRHAQRVLRSQEEEEAATGDISRDELGERKDMAKMVENYTRSAGHAWLTKTSVLFAREITRQDVDETYADVLRNYYGMDVKALEKRQLQALSEMLPGSDVRVNPFGQDVNPAYVAYSGVNGFGAVGDGGGLILGSADPHWTNVFVDTYAASNRNKSPIMGIFGEPGSGKAQPLDSRVLTPDGWKLMGDIHVGDLVIGSDGRATRVNGVYPQGEKDIYRITMNDGSSTRSCGEHLWAVASTTQMWRHPGRWQVKPLDAIRENLSDGQGKLRWNIPVMAPLQLPDRPLPLDPYLVGALIGDGGLTAFIGFSTTDEEVLSYVAGLLPDDTKLVKDTKPHDWRIVGTSSSAGNSVMRALQSLEIYGKRAEATSIPDVYKWGSAEQRLALLQGLLDTDGECTLSGSVLFGTCSEQLALDVRELVQSLGGVARLTTTSKTYTYKNEKRQGRVCYRLAIKLPDQTPPFRLTRKLERLHPHRRSAVTRRIASVEYIGTAPAQCISVEAENHLYVTDDFIVTHNTFAAQLLTAQAALSGQAAIFINPKGFDTLKPFAEWVRSAGGQSRVISMQNEEARGGAFDPFRFCEPKMAAEILTRHINAVLGVTYAGGLTGKQEVELGRGLSEGATAGARCALEALQYVRDPDIREQVLAMVEASTLFGLAFGREPQEPWTAGSGLTLIEFDREMPLPAPGKEAQAFERDERIAVAALRLVSRASLEILMRSRGGVLVVDEAHHFLSSTEGLATLDRIGREGRSLGLLPIFCTQRVTDLLKVDMESFMSRVLTMKLTDPKEGTAALRLCRLEATPSRLAYLAQSSAGLGFYRDLDDRHSVIQVGAGVPEDLRMAMSTNRADRIKREAAAGESTS